MFEGRAVQVVLISLLSTDEARGANLSCASVLICCDVCSNGLVYNDLL